MDFRRKRRAHRRSLKRNSWRALVANRLKQMRTDARVAAADKGFVLDEHGNLGSRLDGPSTNGWLAQKYRGATQAIECADDLVRQWFSTADAVFRSYHSADVELVEFSTDQQLMERVPEVLWLAWSYLHSNDPRRTAFEQRWDPRARAAAAGVVSEAMRMKSQRDARAKHVKKPDRALFSATLRAVYLFQDLALRRVKQLRNLMRMGVFGGLLLLGGLISWASVNPGTFPMCVPNQDPSPTPSVVTTTSLSTATSTVTTRATVTAREPEDVPPKAESPPTPSAGETSEPSPQPPGPEEETDRNRICASDNDDPSPADVGLIALFGAAGGALAAAHVLTTRRIEASAYNLWAWQTSVKIVFGAITAVLGILLLQTHLAPAILTSGGHVLLLTYAVIFGYSQQLVTRLLDKMADTAAAEASPATPVPDPRHSSGGEEAT